MIINKYVRNFYVPSFFQFDEADLVSADFNFRPKV